MGSSGDNLKTTLKAKIYDTKFSSYLKTRFKRKFRQHNLCLKMRNFRKKKTAKIAALPQLWDSFPNHLLTFSGWGSASTPALLLSTFTTFSACVSSAKTFNYCRK